MYFDFEDIFLFLLGLCGIVLAVFGTAWVVAYILTHWPVISCL